MNVRIESGSPVPPFEQIRKQMARMIVSGVLPVGTRLPTIRQLAADLGLAGGTVARAYSELEQAGLIGTRGRRGTFVTEARRKDAAGDDLLRAAKTYALEASQLGARPREALDAARRALAEVT
jgi:DNA-binding transcriptional regulator YhcF (GntR family)